MPRGRPTECPIIRQERLVARLFEQKNTLYQQVIQSIATIHPSIDNHQRAQLSQTLFAVSEEFRLWADAENLLLGVQRNRRLSTALTAQVQHVQTLLGQLSDFYDLYLSTQGFTEQIPSFIRDFNGDFTQLTNAEIPTQTQCLKQVANTLMTQLDAESKPNKHWLQGMRSTIRQAMLFVIHHRMSLVYPPEHQTRTGRPAIPLPVQFVRAEQAMIDAYFALCVLWKASQHKTVSPQKVWQTHTVTIKKQRAGRPTLTKKQRLQRELTKARRELGRLANTCDKPANEHQRGRKPIPLDIKKARLLEKIATLENTLLHYEASPSSL
ncbi:hypothetical protein L4D06_23135 [Enterovibrio makurazakiensis]|uniref:hypothetical protein n=1 Tax=Enterovibrio makurazakiensis TaxID=2910232 RepID=UPI003D1F677A